MKQKLDNEYRKRLYLSLRVLNNLIIENKINTKQYLISKSNLQKFLYKNYKISKSESEKIVYLYWQYH